MRYVDKEHILCKYVLQQTIVLRCISHTENNEMGPCPPQSPALDLPLVTDLQLRRSKGMVLLKAQLYESGKAVECVL